tara:strand:+ start:360 stop:1361 length:1002 start_codon:yes stop_codon:yes gene_type:complete
MIVKSFEIENNIKNISKYKYVLIYGENIGLKEALKNKIKDFYDKAEKINIYQEDIIKNKNIILNEVKNVSLFSEEKIIIINQANEKILIELEDLLDSKENIKIILISELLDKRSKLRALFEKGDNLAVIPCYNDNDITLRKLVQNELKDFQNLNSNIINMIINYSNSNRKTILNNLEKIKSFYIKKILSENTLVELLNSDRNEMFENIRDAALNGDKVKLNELLSNFTFSNEDTYVYFNMINYRLNKILEIHKHNFKNEDFSVAISKLRPPIFWKDKPIYIKLLQKWDKQRVVEALGYLGKIEREIKSNSNINSLTMVKNSITNVCSNSWAYF